jgi:parallel beta-helix repeat protein
MARRRSIIWLGLVCGLLLTPAAALARTFYVDTTTGNNLYTSTQAQNPATPWKTIKRALGIAVGGDTIIVKPGTYMESVESKRDGTASAIITLRSSTPGGAIVRPPAGTNGFFISHNYQTIDGFTVTAAVSGIKAGPHDAGSGPVVGILVQNNTIYGNTSNGIQFTNGLTSEIAFNTVYQNSQNGISYQGNSSVIHDNVVHDNVQFGIYVKDGVDHQVYNNNVYNNTGGNLQILGTLLATQRTFYVDGTNGNDTYTVDQAQNPATPWKTIKTAVGAAQAGDSVLVMPGVYPESVESKRDGTSTNIISIRAATPGTVTVQPPAGTSGFVVSHHYHTVDGFIVSGGLNGVQMGPHDGNSDAAINGLTATNNRVSGNTAVGIKFTNAVGGSAMHNVAYNNGAEGILYSSTGVAANGTIFNNLVYGNGTNQQGKFGITLGGGSGHQVGNNTVHANAVGGILLGTSSGLPVFGAVINNIVTNNPTGIKEQLNSGYTGKATLDYNNVNGNNTNYNLNPTTGTVAGPNSISVAPGFVDAANDDFRLGRVATGQTDSACIDRGSDTSAAVGLGGRTAFTDKSPDTGAVDLGYHGTLLKPSQGTLTVSQILMNLNPTAAGDDFYMTANLKPGADSDGIDLGVNYAELNLGSLVFPMPITGFQPQGAQWVYTGQSGAVTSATFQKLGDGSVSATLQGSGLNLLFNDAPTSFQLKIGDDYGSATLPLRGTLVYP